MHQQSYDYVKVVGGTTKCCNNQRSHTNSTLETKSSTGKMWWCILGLGFKVLEFFGIGFWFWL